MVFHTQVLSRKTYQVAALAAYVQHTVLIQQQVLPLNAQEFALYKRTFIEIETFYLLREAQYRVM